MRVICVLILLLCVPGWLCAEVLPTAKRMPLNSLAKVQTSSLKALDIDDLAVEDIARDVAGLPPRYALPIKTSITPKTEGLWESAGPDHQVWRYRVQAQDATSLNFGFTEFYLPPGAWLMVYASDYSSQIRPFTVADNTDAKQLWTPVLLTSDAVIELTVPNDEVSQVLLTLGQIGQGYRGFGAKKAAAASGKALASVCGAEPIEPSTHGLPGMPQGPGGIKSAEKSGNCNMDIVCVPTSGATQYPAWRETAQAVAVISTGGSTFCTGSLVNNTANDRKMLFVTAAHCSITAANAASLVTYWNFQNSYCRVPGSSASGAAGDGTLTQFNTGAVHKITNSASDFTLVEMSQPGNPAHNLYWAGWDKSAGDFTCTDAANCAAIHQPNTDEKRITFVRENTTTTSYNAPAVPGNSTHVHALWSATPPIFDITGGGSTGTSGNPPAVTEPGSSGSPLYNAQHRFIGQLHGGPSSCGATGGNLSDYYGRFNLSFVPAASLLDPVASGVTSIDGMGACTQPAAPTSVLAVANGNNRIDLSWGAVAGAEYYKVFRALGVCGGAGYSLLAEVVFGTNYSDITVSGGSSYSYQIVSYDVDQSCQSVVSSCASAAATGQCLLAPVFSGLASAQSAGLPSCAVNLAWNASSSQCAGTISYNVYRSTTPAFVPAAGNRIAAGVNAMAYNDAGPLTYNTPYYYQVRAQDAINSVEDGNTVERGVVPQGVVTPGNLVDTFEGAGGFDNPGWTHQAITGANDWTWSTAQSQTPTHSWNSASLGSVSDRVLVSPEFGALAGTTLSFFHTYSFEGSLSSCYDGATLEVSSDAGNTWSVVPDGNFTAGGFTGTINSGFANPLASKRAWCAGTLGAMTQVSVNLGSYAGQTLKLRWHAGDDSSTAATGWFVDSVSLNNAGTAGMCTSGQSDNLFANGFE